MDPVAARLTGDRLLEREDAQRGERAEVLASLDELLALTDGLVVAGTSRNLRAARARLAEDRFNLVVLGEFKRGKSTLINALLGRAVLPTGVVPLTSVVTALRFCQREHLEVRFLDGSRQEHPVEVLSEYVTERENPGNRLGVEMAVVGLDHELLRGGLELVDTPGVGSIHGHNTEVARGFLPRVDAALCVLDAGQPLSDGERELFSEAAERVPRLLIVVNKIDHLEAGDQRMALDFITTALRDLLGERELEVFPVSARGGEGVKALAERLRRLASQERETLLLRSVVGLAGAVAADGAHAARFEARAVELPLEQLEQRAGLFEQRIQELQVAEAEAADLLERGVQRTVAAAVDEPLQAHAKREAPRLRAALREHVEGLGRIAPRELSDELERWIDATVRREFERLLPSYEAAVADELTQLEQRYAQRVQRILEQVQEVAEDVFGARASEVLPETGLRAPSRFTFKLRDPEHGLDMIVGFGRTITPGALGRRFVVRDAEERLLAMTDRHAGRLRSELADRVRRAAAEYRRELSAAVGDAIEAIRSAVQRARRDRQQGQQRVQERLEQLAVVARRCEELEAELRQRSAGPKANASGSS